MLGIRGTLGFSRYTGDIRFCWGGILGILGFLGILGILGKLRILVMLAFAGDTWDTVFF